MQISSFSVHLSCMLSKGSFDHLNFEFKYWNELHFVVVNHYDFDRFFAQPLLSVSLESTSKYWIIKSPGKLLISKNIKVLVVITTLNTCVLNHKKRSGKLFWKLTCVEAREPFKGRIKIFNKVKYWDVKEVDKRKRNQKVHKKITDGEGFPQCTCYAFKILYLFHSNLKTWEQGMYSRLFRL